ncbi:MAG: YoaP domain-containing protein [Bacteroidales bacterium]|nr:YoaP domain-containing protein [Bacteroidales bacterium]
MDNIITLNKTTLDKEHICCAFSDKKCTEGYQLKKDWLKKEFDNGYVFRRLDERAKVFIEYGPSEKAWAPMIAHNYLNINCFWVSGKYKEQGYGKELLRLTEEDAREKNCDGLVTIVGSTKFHFMSDTKWLLYQGFEVVEKLPSGFILLVKKLTQKGELPKFADSVHNPNISKNGIVVYYSNRCPFTEYHVNTSLPEVAAKRNLNLSIVKIKTMEEAQNAPTPATIFSLFLNGTFITTDLSVCLESRFDKLIQKSF